MRNLKAADIERLRSCPGCSAALFITDRCPVGCAHCSVDSRSDSPTIADYDLFRGMLEGLCREPALEIVGITGGEPFVERRGLELATQMLAEAGKKIVLYSSGVWSKSETPAWVRGVLKRVSTIYLSTDLFHLQSISPQTFVAAAHAAAEWGCWIVVQTLENGDAPTRAIQYLETAFGPTYSESAEIVLCRPLPYGRAETLFHPAKPKPGAEYGACGILGSPLVRYDGRVTACCNEKVIMGGGSARLATKCRTTPDFSLALAKFRNDPLLKTIGTLGFGALSAHPKFAAVGRSEFGSICEACWAANDAAGPMEETSDELLHAISILGERQDS
jgi:hypothetical protein